MNSLNTNRTAHLLALMKKGDDAFNARDVAAMNATHHPDLIAHVTGSAKPIFGRTAHAAMIQQMLRIFPDVHVHNDLYPIQFGSGDWITVNHPHHRNLHRRDEAARRQGDRPDRKCVRPQLFHNRQVGRRRDG
jgi:ketosteroid isomerase-like protein